MSNFQRSLVMDKAGESQENIYFRFTDHTQYFDCVDHSKAWKLLKEMGTPDHLFTCLLRNLYAGSEAKARTGHGTTHQSKVGKEDCEAMYYHPSHLTSVQMNQSQAGIKVSRRNINNLRYTDDTILMAESEEN